MTGPEVTAAMTAKRCACDHGEQPCDSCLRDGDARLRALRELMGVGPERTPASERAAKAWSAIPGYPTQHRAKAALAAALNRDDIARSIADNLHGQDVHTLVMRRPGESSRDHAERIGQWAAGVVVASVLGSGS